MSADHSEAAATVAEDRKPLKCPKCRRPGFRAVLRVHADVLQRTDTNDYRLWFIPTARWDILRWECPYCGHTSPKRYKHYAKVTLEIE